MDLNAAHVLCAAFPVQISHADRNARIDKHLLLWYSYRNCTNLATIRAILIMKRERL